MQFQFCAARPRVEGRCSAVYLLTRDLFNCTRSNPSNAQLVFTTHETSILSQDIFRRDQIWFCEKGQDKSTSLYSLHDFRVRKGVENIERNYLSGKYGAMPFIESFCGEE